jgi:hypothetical protein
MALASAATACGADGAGTLVETATSTAASTSSGGPQTIAIFASIVPESEAGSAPALVALAHDTAHFVTLDLPGALFYQIAAGQAVDPQLAVSASLEEDVRVGYCDVQSPNAPCIWVPLGAYAGPAALDPSLEHTLHVSEPRPDLWELDVTTAPLAAPFRAIRGWGLRTDTGNRSLVIEADGVELEPFALPIDDYPSSYRLLASVDTTVTAVTYVDRYGTAHSATLDAPLAGADAFTIAVAIEPAPGAIATAELSPPLDASGLP